MFCGRPRALQKFLRQMARVIDSEGQEEEEEEDEEEEVEDEEEEENKTKDEVVKMVNGELALRGGILLPFSSRYATQRKKMSTLSSDDRPVHERMQLNSEDSEVGDDADDDYGTTELELTPEKSLLMISEKVLLLPSGMTTFSVDSLPSSVSGGDYLFVRRSSDAEQEPELEEDVLNDCRTPNSIPRITIQSISSTPNSPSEVTTQSSHSTSPHELSVAANWTSEGDHRGRCKRTSFQPNKANRHKLKKTSAVQGPLQRVDFTELRSTADSGLAADPCSLMLSHRESSFVQFSTKFSFSSQGQGQGHGHESAVGLSANLARRKRAAKREKKATKTLAIVLG